MQGQSLPCKSSSFVSRGIFAFILSFEILHFYHITEFFGAPPPEMFVHEANETFSSPLSWFCKPHVKTCAFQGTHIAFMVKNINISVSF